MTGLRGTSVQTSSPDGPPSPRKRHQSIIFSCRSQKYDEGGQLRRVAKAIRTRRTQRRIPTSTNSHRVSFLPHVGADRTRAGAAGASQRKGTAVTRTSRAGAQPASRYFVKILLSEAFFG
ncbi:hypothetical protein EVAR_37429_1 [Eumeta japonica]|uniref:Uncharacterized protein n=1 Tax=Eumeta variegata TaxID=151549 RepID=A0A4C1WHP1_EUMVA|nr:hypothetical protein EVAR_37429_1 [Eumeta japonica]